MNKNEGHAQRDHSYDEQEVQQLLELEPYRWSLWLLWKRDKVGDAWNGWDRFFMFAHIDGSPFHHERPYLWFRQFIQKNGLRYIRFHDLRHTSATLLINQGVHAKIISERLGHGSITTTMNIYGHALRSADQAAADKLETLFPIRQKLKNNIGIQNVIKPAGKIV